MKGLQGESKEILIRRGYTIAVAESLTGGLLQDFFVSQSGSSAYFLGGITTYTVEMKSELLQVDFEMAKACSGVSQQVAIEMALGVCDLFHSDFGLSTTGFAEPDSGKKIDKPLAFFAIVFRGEVVSEGKISESLSRNDFRKLVAERVGEELDKWLFFNQVK